MGGCGSNRWNGHQKAPIREGGLFIDVRWYLLPEGVVFAWNKRMKAFGRYTRRGDWLDMIYTLTTRWIQQDYQQSVELTSISVTFGGRVPHGKRWYFRCPECGRLCGRLYLHPETRLYFACRQCHGLTYLSCQTSHDFERSASPFLRYQDVRLKFIHACERLMRTYQGSHNRRKWETRAFALADELDRLDQVL